MIDNICEVDPNITREDVTGAISTWVEDYLNREAPPSTSVHTSPETIVTMVNEEENRITEEENERKEREKILEEEDAQRQRVEVGKRSHERLKEGANWLEKIIDECEDKVTTEVYSKMGDALRVAREQERAVAPKKKQRAIVDFFSKSRATENNS